MKKILFALAAVAIMFASCETVDKLIGISVDKAVFTESGSTTATKTMTSTVTNTTSNSGTIAWDFSETTAIAGWTYTITINGNAATSTSGTFDIAGGATATIEVTVNPNSTAGVGAATLTLKDNSDSRMLRTIAYGYTAAQTSPSFSLSKNTDSGSASVSAPGDPEYKTVLTNLTSSPLEITWSRTDSPAAGWQFATCDVQCYAPFITTKTYTLAANATLDFKTVVYPNNMTGTGSSSTVIYLASDSANTAQKFDITHTATL